MDPSHSAGLRPVLSLWLMSAAIKVAAIAVAVLVFLRLGGRI